MEDITLCHEYFRRRYPMNVLWEHSFLSLLDEQVVFINGGPFL